MLYDGRMTPRETIDALGGAAEVAAFLSKFLKPTKPEAVAMWASRSKIPAYAVVPLALAAAERNNRRAVRSLLNGREKAIIKIAGYLTDG